MNARLTYHLNITFSEETGMIEQTLTKGLTGLRSLVLNEKKLVSILRKAAENTFAACKQEKIMQNIVGQRNLRGLRHQTVQRLGYYNLKYIQQIFLSIFLTFFKSESQNCGLAFTATDLDGHCCHIQFQVKIQLSAFNEMHNMQKNVSEITVTKNSKLSTLMLPIKLVLLIASLEDLTFQTSLNCIPPGIKNGQEARKTGTKPQLVK